MKDTPFFQFPFLMATTTFSGESLASYNHHRRYLGRSSAWIMLVSSLLQLSHRGLTGSSKSGQVILDYNCRQLVDHGGRKGNQILSMYIHLHAYAPNSRYSHYLIAAPVAPTPAWFFLSSFPNILTEVDRIAKMCNQAWTLYHPGRSLAEIPSRTSSVYRIFHGSQLLYDMKEH